jgi:tetratricopeptide (TPR) repeat protein
MKFINSRTNVVLGVLVALCVNLLFLGFKSSHAQELSLSPSAPDNRVATAPVQSETDLMRQALLEIKGTNWDDALNSVNKVLQLDSQSKDAHMLRAMIYAQQRQWDKADYDYQLALLLEPQSATIKFDMAELRFMQKKYSEARPSFVELQSDKELGDFAAYKVFLCDLFGAHVDLAAKELDVFNRAGENPSYYFGNAAWDLFHNNNEEAAGWLKSAGYIYANSPQKFSNYVASLKDLGYWPLHLSSSP